MNKSIISRNALNHFISHSSLDETVMEFIRTETARSATTVGNGTEIEGFERTQTMDPVDKVNMGPMIDTRTNDK